MLAQTGPQPLQRPPQPLQACPAPRPGPTPDRRRQQRCASSTEEAGASSVTEPARLGPALAALCTTAAASLPAAAAEAVAYDASGGAELLKTLGGVAYLALVGGFVVRLWGKRSKTSLTQRLASVSRYKAAQAPGYTKLQTQAATPLNAAWGALQAGVCAVLLFLLTTQVDAFLLGQPLPEQYTARSVAVTLETIARGLAYLITFVFGFNCLGLSALTVQLLFWPESDTDSLPAIKDLIVEVRKSELGPEGDKRPS